MKRVLVIAAALLLLGCSARATATPRDVCTREDIRSFVSKRLGISERFNSLVKLAASTPRVSLVGVVREMQDVHKEYARLWAPRCIEAYHTHMCKSMELTIDGFLAFMAQDEDEASSHFEKAADYLRWASEALDNAMARAK